MRHILTALSGADNASIDMGRVLWAVGMLSLCGMEFVAVLMRGQVFDPVTFATAQAAVLTAGGGALLLKAKTEPKA